MTGLAEDSKNAYGLLDAHGLAVGLTDGLMGNSEVGWVYLSLLLPVSCLLGRKEDGLLIEVGGTTAISTVVQDVSSGRTSSGSIRQSDRARCSSRRTL